MEAVRDPREELLNREAIQRHLEVSLEDAYPEDEP